MKRFLCILAVCSAISAPSRLQAMDVYEWRAGVERICAAAFHLLERPIRIYRAGVRPEPLVMEKMRGLTSAVMDEYLVDEETANRIIASLVRSNFTDERLHWIIPPPAAYQKAYGRCKAGVLKYDPSGARREAYREKLAAERKRVEEELEAPPSSEPEGKEETASGTTERQKQEQ